MTEAITIRPTIEGFNFITHVSTWVDKWVYPEPLKITTVYPDTPASDFNSWQQYIHQR